MAGSSPKPDGLTRLPSYLSDLNSFAIWLHFCIVSISVWIKPVSVMREWANHLMPPAHSCCSL